MIYEGKSSFISVTVAHLSDQLEITQLQIESLKKEICTHK